MFSSIRPSCTACAPALWSSVRTRASSALMPSRFVSISLNITAAPHTTTATCPIMPRIRAIGTRLSRCHWLLLWSGIEPPWSDMALKPPRPIAQRGKFIAHQLLADNFVARFGVGVGNARLFTPLGNKPARHRADMLTFAQVLDAVAAHCAHPVKRWRRVIGAFDVKGITLTVDKLLVDFHEAPIEKATPEGMARCLH